MVSECDDGKAVGEGSLGNGEGDAEAVFCEYKARYEAMAADEKLSRLMRLVGKGEVFKECGDVDEAKKCWSQVFDELDTVDNQHRKYFLQVLE